MAQEGRLISVDDIAYDDHKLEEKAAKEVL